MTAIANSVVPVCSTDDRFANSKQGRAAFDSFLPSNIPTRISRVLRFAHAQRTRTGTNTVSGSIAPMLVAARIEPFVDFSSAFYSGLHCW